MMLGPRGPRRPRVASVFMASAKKKSKGEGKPLDPMSISTWARIKSAGKAPIGGKPYGAEVSGKKKPKAKP